MSMTEAGTLTDHEALLKEIREFRDYAWNRSQKNREQGDLDMKALSVEGPWPDAELKARKDDKNPRPHGHTDIISPYNNRVVNQARMNPRGVEVIPKGVGADEKTAEKRENRIRGIDYESHASQARLTALQNAVDRAIGYWRVDTEFEHARSRNLKIVVKRIANPNSILDDPDCQEADRSDRKKLLATQWIPIPDAKRRWKGLKEPADFSLDVQSAATAWTSRPGQMMFAEFWKVHETTERLLFVNGSPDGVFESELAEGAKIEGQTLILADGQKIPIDDEREGVSKKVIQYFTNGLQIFEQKDWPGTTIPFPCCVGREKYEGDDLVIESLTRKLRQPQLDFDVVRAAESESISMTPKSKWQISDKAIAGYEDMYKLAHKSPLAYLLHHERDEQGNPTTKPERIDYEPQVNALEIAANSYIRDVQNAAGMVGIDRKQRENQSGVAQDKIDEASDIASFHFIDSWLAAIEFEGRIENELLTVIEDSTRTVGFRSKDGKYKPDTLQPMKMPDGSVQHPYGESDSHGITISTAPNYQSQQQKAKEYLTELTKQPEFVANPLSPMIIEGMQLGPTGDKMKEIAIAVQPPNVQAIYQDDGEQEPIPQRAKQAIQQAEQGIKALNAHSQQLEAENAELKQKLDAQVIQSDSKERMNTENNETKLAVANIGAKQKMLADEVAAFMLKMDRVFDVLMQAQGHAQGLDAAEHQADLGAQSQAAQQQHETEMAAAAQAQQSQDNA